MAGPNEKTKYGFPNLRLQNGVDNLLACQQTAFGVIHKFQVYVLPFDNKTVTMADLDEYQPPDWCRWKLENPTIQESGFEEAKAA